MLDNPYAAALKAWLSMTMRMSRTVNICSHDLLFNRCSTLTLLKSAEGAVFFHEQQMILGL